MGKFLRVTSWRKAMSMMSSLALLVGLITTSSVTAHAAPAADITATAVVGTTIHQATRKTPRLDRATHLTTFTSIPEVQRYTPHIGSLPFYATEESRIVLAPGAPHVVRRDAQLVAQELPIVYGWKDMKRLPVVFSTRYRRGDIVLRLKPAPGITGARAAEGYRMQLGVWAEIQAPTARGLFYGTRTLLQSLAARGSAPAGIVVDWPSKTHRIFHVDAGRKYFSPDWFKEHIRRMSYVKLNELQYHFSENEGFRLESTQYPQLMSKQYITKAQLRDIIAYAERYHVEIVPAFDVPGHMRVLLNHFPQYRASQTPEGQKILNYADPKAMAFIKSLLSEYTVLFPSTTWHLGGDEVFDLDSTLNQMGRNFPQLLAYARRHAKAGQSATILDGYTYFLNQINDYLRSLGKTDIRAWNDALYWDGTTESLDPRITITYWSEWSKAWQSVAEIRRHGHKIINFNGDYLYYTLTTPGQGYYLKPSVSKIYSWAPGVLPQRPGTTILRGQEERQYWQEPSPSWITGGAFSVWCDKPDVATQESVSQGVNERLRAFAAKMWKSQPTTSVVRFRLEHRQIGEPPNPQPESRQLAGYRAVLPRPTTLMLDVDGRVKSYQLKRVVVSRSQASRGSQLWKDAQLVASELSQVTGYRMPVVQAPDGGPASAQEGDVRLQRGDVAGTSGNPEAYRIRTVDGRVTITGPTHAGIFWGTRTLLQGLRASGFVQTGEIVDYPAKPVRALNVDAGRKYFSPRWFKQQIRRMSYLKMNELELHFSENEGFRLESKRHPEVMLGRYITQAELRDIIAYAQRYHVEIVPSFDMPGHFRAALTYHPRFRAASTDEGMKILDYSNPQAVAYLNDLLSELLPLFPSTRLHMGGDEVFYPNGGAEGITQRFPKLLAYAKKHAAAGEKATIFDGFMYFLNQQYAVVKALGKTDVRVWNDALYWKGTTETLNPAIDVAYWTMANENAPSVKTVREHGHKIINYNDHAFYYNLTYPGLWYYDRPTVQRIYSWVPGDFPWQPGATVHSPAGDRQYYGVPSPEWVRGGCFSIWTDHPEVETEQQVADGVYLRLRAMAAKVWNPVTPVSLVVFRQQHDLIGDAPYSRVP